MPAREQLHSVTESVPDVHLHIAVRTKDQNGHICQLLGEVIQQGERGVVRPLEVLEHQQKWPQQAGTLEEVAQTVEEVAALVLSR